jgi:hypothetical protein
MMILKRCIGRAPVHPTVPARWYGDDAKTEKMSLQA